MPPPLRFKASHAASRVRAAREEIQHRADDHRKPGHPHRGLKPDPLLGRGRGGFREPGRAPGAAATRASDTGGPRPGSRWRRLLGGDRGDEAPEEVFGHLAGDRVDQARADLRQLAADMRLDGISQYGCGVILGEVDLGAALGETGDAAGTFPGDRIALRRARSDNVTLPRRWPLPARPRRRPWR